MPHLEITKVILVHCNIADSNYQHYSIIVCIFVPNKPFVQLLEISPTSVIFLKTFHSEFSYTKVWLTDQNSNPLEIEERINLFIKL